MDPDGSTIAAIELNDILHPIIAILFTKPAGPYFKNVMAILSSEIALQAYSMFSRAFTTIGDRAV